MYNIVNPKKKKRKNPSRLAARTFSQWKKFINVLHCGYWFSNPKPPAKPGPRFSNAKADWELFERYKGGERPRNRYGEKFEPWHLRQMRANHLDDAMRGDRLYYTSGTKGFAALMVDIDAHNGETDLAESFCDIITIIGKENCFPEMSERGGHAFILLDCQGKSSEEVNQLADQLQARLKNALAHRQCAVEVRGKIRVGNDKGEAGTLARLPVREDWSEDRLQEFIRTPVKTYSWLQELVALLPNSSPRGAKRKRGSTTGLYLSEDQLATIPAGLDYYLPMAQHCYAMRVDTDAKGVNPVTVVDFQCGFLCLATIAMKPNEDDQVPTALVEAIWKRLYDQGIFTRAWNNSRWKVIRNAMADCDYVEEIDRRYWFDPRKKETGEVGKAMQFKLRSEFCWSFDHVFGEEEGICARAFSPGKFIRCRWRPKRIDGMFPYPDKPSFTALDLEILEQTVKPV
jgi:hypothetical protein